MLALDFQRRCSPNITITHIHRAESTIENALGGILDTRNDARAGAAKAIEIQITRLNGKLALPRLARTLYCIYEIRWFVI